MYATITITVHKKLAVTQFLYDDIRRQDNRNMLYVIGLFDH